MNLVWQQRKLTGAVRFTLATLALITTFSGAWGLTTENIGKILPVVAVPANSSNSSDTWKEASFNIQVPDLLDAGSDGSDGDREVCLDTQKLDLDAEVHGSNSLVSLALDQPIFKLSDDSAGCPHATFILKHLCKNCNSLDDALEFSKERRIGYYKTNVNSVIFGEPKFTKEGNSCHCEGVKVVTCTIGTKNCRIDGDNCKARHSTGNGHLFYHEISC